MSEKQQNERGASIQERLVSVQKRLKNPQKTHEVKKKGTSKKTGEEYVISYRYAPLDSAIEDIRAACNAEGVAILQPITSPEPGIMTIQTIVTCGPGEDETMTLSALDYNIAGLNPQEIGIIITYLRRYTLFSAFGLAGEDDTDAQDMPPQRTPVESASTTVSDNGMSAKQRAKIMAMAKSLGMDSEDLHAIMEEVTGKTSSRDLTSRDASVLIGRLQELIDIRTANQE